MKAISLHQPWATLVAVGAKRIETRSWMPPRLLVGHRIAIHAAKRVDTDFMNRSDAFKRAWHHHNIYLPVARGAIVCTAVLDRVELISRPDPLGVSLDEIAFGHYERGRYAWHLADVEILPYPGIPTVGRQGFFDVPDPRTEPRLSGDPVNEQEAAACSHADPARPSSSPPSRSSQQ